MTVAERLVADPLEKCLPRSGVVVDRRRRGKWKDYCPNLFSPGICRRRRGFRAFSGPDSRNLSGDCGGAARAGKRLTLPELAHL